MKTYQWKLRRQFIAVSDAQQRWDRVYQNLLHWTRCQPLQQTSKLTLIRFRRAFNGLELRGWKTFLHTVPFAFLFYHNKRHTSNISFCSLLSNLFIGERADISKR